MPVAAGASWSRWPGSPRRTGTAGSSSLSVVHAGGHPRLVERAGPAGGADAGGRDKTFGLAAADKTHYRSVGRQLGTRRKTRRRAAACAAAPFGCRAVSSAGRRSARSPLLPAAAAPGRAPGCVEAGDPAGDVAGHVLRGQAQVGEDLRAGAVRVPAGRHAQVAQRHLDVGVAHRLGERVADTADPDAVLEGDHQPVRGGQLDQLGRDRAHPARVDDGDAVALLGDPGGDLHAQLAEGADRDEQHVGARGLGAARRPGRPGAAPAGPRRPNRSGSARWSGRRRRRPPRAAPRGAWRRRGARRSAAPAPRRRPTCPRCRSGSGRPGR